MPYNHKIFKYVYERQNDTDEDVVVIPLEVEYYHVPGSPQVSFYRNGDPGHPEEPEEIEIVSIKYDDTKAEVADWFKELVIDEITEEAWKLHEQSKKDPI